MAYKVMHGLSSAFLSKFTWHQAQFCSLFSNYIAFFSVPSSLHISAQPREVIDPFSPNLFWLDLLHCSKLRPPGETGPPAHSVWSSHHVAPCLMGHSLPQYPLLLEHHLFTCLLLPPTHSTLWQQLTTVSLAYGRPKQARDSQNYLLINWLNQWMKHTWVFFQVLFFWNIIKSHVLGETHS